MNCRFVVMNFLAHAYLSFNDPQILVGNMVSDFVKGKARFGFNGKITRGIRLHRMIDEFTDGHPVTARAKEFFRPAYRLYSGPIVDVLYDHYLANDPTIFTDSSLKSFTATVYSQLEQHASELPQRFLLAFTYMRTDDWLYHYRYREGIRKGLGGLVRRAAYLSESDTAYNLFNEHYVPLGECYREFFPELVRFVKAAMEEERG